MRGPISAFVCGVLLSGFCAAQVAPGISKGQHDNKVLTFGPNGNVPAFNFNHIAFFRLPFDSPGTWTTCISVNLLQARWGGKGGDDVLLGKYNRTTKKFTPTTLAANLNSAGGEGSFMVDERTGRFAVIDRADGFYFAHRPRPGLRFSVPVKIQGLVAGIIKPFEDPALGWVGGKLMLFWAQSFVFMAPLNITNLNAPSVPPKAQWIKVTGNGLVEQPVPLTGPDGDVEGLLGVNKPGGSDTDLTFLEDLDPKTIDHTVFDTPQFTDGGGVAGSLIGAADRVFSKNVRQIQVSWLLGDVEKVGGIADIFGATARVGTNPVATVVLFAAKPTAGIPIPGIKGKFALDFATLLVLGLMSHATASEHGKLQFPIPNNSAFKGVRIALQGLSVDPVAGTSTFTNTAWLAFR